MIAVLNEENALVQAQFVSPHVELPLNAQRWVFFVETLGSAETAWDGSSTLTSADLEKLGEGRHIFELANTESGT